MDILIDRYFSKPVAYVLHMILCGLRSITLCTLLFTLWHIHHIEYGFIGYDNLFSFFLLGIAYYIILH